MEEQKDIIMQASGFVILPRLSIKNLRDKLIFYYLLEQADWNTGEVKVNVSELERETGWTRWEIKGSLDRLAAAGLITCETLRQKRGTLVKITKYEEFQSLSHYKKGEKNPHEKPQENAQEVPQGNPQEKEGANPCGTRDSGTTKNVLPQENPHEKPHEDAHENPHLLFNNSIINSNSNSNINNKPNTSLVSEKDIETFVDENIDILPSGTNRKLLIRYCDMLRLTRSTCKISRNVLLQVFAKMSKYSRNQINFAIWHHFEKHDDKREQYTIGILRNTSDDEAYRKLMRMLNRGGDKNELSFRPSSQNVSKQPGPSEETRRLEEIAAKKGLIASGEIRDIECDF
jgi:DNA-binding MarR family transcriptional regulator